MLEQHAYALGAALIGAIFSAGVFVPFSMRIAPRIGAIDQPGDLKIHKQPVPRLGGFGVLIAALLVGLGAYAIYGHLTAQLIALAAGTAIIAAVGFFDDMKGLAQTKKFIMEGAIAAACVFFLAKGVDWWLLPLAWVWLVGLLNAYNFIDGMDGLFAGIAAINLVTVGVLFLLAGAMLPALIAFGTAGALLGFLHFNLEPARTFMGDGGALGIGFLIAGLSLLYVGSSESQFSSTMAVLLAAAIPVGDVTFAVLRRLIMYRTVNPAILFQGDRFHYYDQMQNNAGMPVKRIVFMSCGVAVVLAIMGVVVRDALAGIAFSVGAMAAVFMTVVAATSGVRVKTDM